MGGCQFFAGLALLWGCAKVPGAIFNAAGQLGHHLASVPYAMQQLETSSIVLLFSQPSRKANSVSNSSDVSGAACTCGM